MDGLVLQDIFILGQNPYDILTNLLRLNVILIGHGEDSDCNRQREYKTCQQGWFYIATDMITKGGFKYNLLKGEDMLTTNISTNVIIGMALVEILNGELTDQTIAAVCSINYQEVPPPLNHLVGYIQGMNTDPAVRASQITSLMAEIGTIAKEERDDRLAEKPS